MKKVHLLFVFVLIVAATINAQPTVSDYDGNVYNTVTIGTQIWLKENLKASHYADGSIIPLVTGGTSWQSLSTGARCYYNNDSATYAGTYGALYNWFAVTDSRNMCPAGWHVATDAEWSTLIAYAGGSPLADSVLCYGCSSGFDGQLGGLLSAISGSFANEGSFGYYWSSTQQSADNAWCFGGFRISAPQMNNRDYNAKTAGLSVRCIKDTSTLLNETGAIIYDLFPNPASCQLIIKCEPSEMKIYNTSGACIINRYLDAGANSIDINALPAGLYLIILQNEKGSVTRKLVVE